MTRPVTVFEWWRPEGSKLNVPYEKRRISAGAFHQFGTDYEEFENGAANYSTAIVELPDGNVVNVAVALIRFEG